jgi:diguanylate cyclase (GGDEF)-like protein/PAS domain S-box-containing protein
MTKNDATHQAILNALLDGVAFVNKDLRVIFWSAAAERITGFMAAEIISRPTGLAELEDEAGRPLSNEARRPLLQTLEDGRPRKVFGYLRHKHGHRVPVCARVSALRDAQGVIGGGVICFWDSAPTREQEERLKSLQQDNLLDPLTGVGNRRFADQILNMEMVNLQRHGAGLGLLFADIDRFKRINDTYGHLVGDKVLKMVARALSKSLRSYDAVARWGGEEFLVILPHVSSAQQLEKIGERLRLLVESASVEDGGRPIQATVTIGGCTALTDDTAQCLLARADRLMYQGKAQGRNQVVVSGGKS